MTLRRKCALDVAMSAIVALVAIALVIPGHAQPAQPRCPVGGVPMISCPGVSDAVLEGKIVARLSGSIIGVTQNDVRVSVDNGVATLTGQVTGSAASNDASTLAASVTGVKRVINEIAVVPTQNPDFRLIEEVRQELDNSPGSFKRISVRAADGVVQLGGIVASELERDVAEVAAASVRGVEAVHNDIFVRNAKDNSGW